MNENKINVYSKIALYCFLGSFLTIIASYFCINVSHMVAIIVLLSSLALSISTLYFSIMIKKNRSNDVDPSGELGILLSIGLIIYCVTIVIMLIVI